MHFLGCGGRPDQALQLQPIRPLGWNLSHWVLDSVHSVAEPFRAWVRVWRGDTRCLVVLVTTSPTRRVGGPPSVSAPSSRAASRPVRSLRLRSLRPVHRRTVTRTTTARRKRASSGGAAIRPAAGRPNLATERSRPDGPP